MKRTLAFFLVLSAAVLLLLSGTIDRSIVWADDCKASATATVSPGKNTKCVISSDVSSRDCVKLQCRGFVHYLVSYHLPNGKKDQAHALNDFRIDPGAQHTHIAMEYSVGVSGAVLDDVKVESVSCITTAP